MREILFRGKMPVESKWAYGSLILETNAFDEKLVLAIISDADGNEVLVNPETVGQYTGLTDKNETRFFEGDIVRGRSEYFGHGNFYRGVVFWREGRFVISFGDSVEACERLEDTEELREWHEDVEVIGNIFDEPELLENGGKVE